MDFLGNILSGEDLVNKDHVDKAIPTSLKNPYALTFGSKTYDGSAAKTITASDLGALTSHQSIYGLTINNSAGTSVLSYTPNSAAKTLTLTKAMVGLGNVENTALSTWAGTSKITTLGTITSGTWNGSTIANAYLGNVPYAGVVNSTDDLQADLKARRSFIGSVMANSVWQNILSVRHRNGSEDGNAYGMYFRSTLTTQGSLVWNKEMNGTWQGERTILDSNNYTGYALPLSGGTITGGVLTLDSALGAYAFIRFKDRRIFSGGYADNIIQITDADNAIHGSFGLYGNTNGLSYLYIGCETDGYNSNTNFRIYSDKLAFGSNTLIHSGNVGSYNAGSATKLQTARTIWGQSFDGTGNVDGRLVFNGKTAIDDDGGQIYTIFGNVSGASYLRGSSVYLQYGTKEGLILNSSGNVTIGASDLAGTDYKLLVSGTSRFSDRASVASLRIIPVNGSYAADFAMDGSSLTLNRELKFTNVTASDISPNIAAAFKTSLAQVENLIASNIILGTTTGTASSLGFSIKKYGSVSSNAPASLTTLFSVDTSGLVTAKGGLNVTASEGVVNTGQGGVAGVFLRNEGGIEICHASTPYIDFHYANSTGDYNLRLVAKATNILAFDGGSFCPYSDKGENLGSSTYRWSYVYANGGNFSGAMTIGGALTVGGTSTFNGDVKINGNLVVTGDTASGGTSDGTIRTLGALALTFQDIESYEAEGVAVDQEGMDRVGLTEEVFDNLMQGLYTKVIGSDITAVYSYSGFANSSLKVLYLFRGTGTEYTCYKFTYIVSSATWTITLDES